MFILSALISVIALSILVLCVPPGGKPSGEQSGISWAYYQEVVRTNEIVRSVITT